MGVCESSSSTNNKNEKNGVSISSFGDYSTEAYSKNKSNKKKFQISNNNKRWLHSP